MSVPPRFADIPNRETAITTFSTSLAFPESLDAGLAAYQVAVNEFGALVERASSSAELLALIRDNYRGKDLMSLLKIFRRCVSPVCDTERSRKIRSVSTDSLIKAFGATFKSIDILKAQFKAPLAPEAVHALCVLLAENDSRGQSGYALTAAFFDWFGAEPALADLEARGPRGAGSDIQLNTLLTDFDANYPCDLVITDGRTSELLAVGFARYDATRGGSQSDDRTGGNANKVDKARRYIANGGKAFRLLFISDGPGLLHNDTWTEACALDGALDGSVRVTTLKLSPYRVTRPWLVGQPE